MGRTLGYALALVLATSLAVVPNPAPPPVLAEDEPKDPIKAAEKLADEAEKFYLRSGNTDLRRKERVKARKEAYTRLKKARGYLDAYIDEHPGEVESLDALYVRISSMIFWIKKEASVGELDSAPKKRPLPPIVRKKKPEPDTTKPTEPEPPPEPQGPTAAEVLAEIETYEKRFPGDVPGLFERYTEFLAAFPDPSTSEYARAADKVAKFGERLKNVYRTLRNEDPDELANADSGEVRKLVGQLAPDLEAESAPVRKRAAEFLGKLGSGEAADPLITALKAEDDGDVVDAICAALARIGGKRVCKKLGRIRKKAALEGRVAAIYYGMLERGGVPARIGADALGAYLERLTDEERLEAIDKLKSAGKPAGYGLSMGLRYAKSEDVAGLIDHVGEQGDPRSGENLTVYLRAGVGGALRDQARAARKAIRKLGPGVVPYLFNGLDDDTTRLTTASLLRRITEARPKDDKRRTWERWWKKNRRDFLRGR